MAEHKILDLHIFTYEEESGKRNKSKKKTVLFDSFVKFLCLKLACGKCKKYLSRADCPCILSAEKCTNFQIEKKLADKYFKDIFYGEGIGTPILKKEK